MTRHSVYLSIGSNIDPEHNLPLAIRMLSGYGNIQAVSSAWESHAVGSPGPNFLNASVLLVTEIPPAELKRQVVEPIELACGRVRTSDPNAPRTIDLDVMMVDGQPLHVDRWDNAFVLLPIAELLPEARHPTRTGTIGEAAEQARRATWIIPRPGVLAQHT